MRDEQELREMLQRTQRLHRELITKSLRPGISNAQHAVVTRQIDEVVIALGLLRWALGEFGDTTIEGLLGLPAD